MELSTGSIPTEIQQIAWLPTQKGRCLDSGNVGISQHLDNKMVPLQTSHILFMVWVELESQETLARRLASLGEHNWRLSEILTHAVRFLEESIWRR